MTQLDLTQLEAVLETPVISGSKTKSVSTQLKLINRHLENLGPQIEPKQFDQIQEQLYTLYAKHFAGFASKLYHGLNSLLSAPYQREHNNCLLNLKETTENLIMAEHCIRKRKSQIEAFCLKDAIKLYRVEAANTDCETREKAVEILAFTVQGLPKPRWSKENKSIRQIKDEIRSQNTLDYLRLDNKFILPLFLSLPKERFLQEVR